MTWYANQIYAKPTAEVIAAFRTQPFLADRLYHVDDLRGVRFQWSREMLLSSEPPGDREHMRHGLPPGGLLVASPEIYKTSYDGDDSDVGDFARHYRHNTPWGQFPPGAKWQGLRALEGAEPFFPPDLEREHFSVDLLKFLKWVYDQTGSASVYYQCAMWGGSIEDETAWIIDEVDRVYQFRDDETVIEHTDGGSRVIKGDLLQLAMKSVGLDLPTRFFALHEGSFDWKLYRIEDGT